MASHKRARAAGELQGGDGLLFPNTSQAEYDAVALTDRAGHRGLAYTKGDLTHDLDSQHGARPRSSEWGTGHRCKRALTQDPTITSINQWCVVFPSHSN